MTVAGRIVISKHQEIEGKKKKNKKKAENKEANTWTTLFISTSAF